jgi:hypothetical protein
MNKKYNNPLATSVVQGIKAKIHSRSAFMTPPRSTSGRRSMKVATRGVLLRQGEGTAPVGTTMMMTAIASPPSPPASPTVGATMMMTAPVVKDFKPVRIPKYDGKQNPRQWIRCYFVAIEVSGGSNSTKALYLPVALESTPLTWLESLKPNSIDLWEDLKRAIIDNFQGSMITPPELIWLKCTITIEAIQANMHFKRSKMTVSRVTSRCNH